MFASTGQGRSCGSLRRHCACPRVMAEAGPAGLVHARPVVHRLGWRRSRHHRQDADARGCGTADRLPLRRGRDRVGPRLLRDTMRNAMLVGLTVDSMRLADVFVALEVLRRQPGVDAQRIMTLGQGASGVLGLYAAILDPGVHQVMLVNPPSTHADAPIFLNILRHTDLPEAAALLAPRHLSFLPACPALSTTRATSIRYTA